MNYQNFCTLISLKKSANYPWKSNGTLAIFQKISPEIPAEIVDFFCVGISALQTLGKLVLYYKKEEGCSLEILKKTDSAYESVAYDQVKTALSESQAEVEE